MDEKLFQVASNLKLEIFDLDEGVYGFDSKNPKFGLEVVQAIVDLNGNDGIGLVLTEMAGDNDGRGLTLVSAVTGQASLATNPIQIGDTITGVIVDDQDYRERSLGLNYDRTVEILSEAKELAIAGKGKLQLELNRLVERASITVEVDTGDSKTVIDALAGENLRRLMMRKGINLYDRDTKRFDMPFATGDCAGEGLCGTCLVAVTEGQDSLNPKDSLETMLLKGRPLNWRATCRTVVGFDNKPASIKVQTRPQSRFEDELNPGVRPLN